MCYDIISGQSLLTNFCSCSMLQSRWNRFVAMIVNALNPVQGTIFGSGGHMRVEQKFSDFVFCTSNRELSLQTTLIRDLRVALGHVVNPKKITGVFQQKISFGNHFLLVLLFCTIFSYCISIAFSSNRVLRTIAISGESPWRPQLSHCVRVIWPLLPDSVRMPLHL